MQGNIFFPDISEEEWRRKIFKEIISYWQHPTNNSATYLHSRLVREVSEKKVGKGLWEVRSPTPEWHLFHRYIELFGLEGTSWDHLLQSHRSKWGQPRQVSQDLIQVGSEHLQGWKLYSPSVRPVPVFHHPRTRKDFFSFVSGTYFCLCSLPLVLSLDSTDASLAPSSLLPFIKVFIHFGKIPLSLLFSRLNSLSSIGFSFYGICSNPKSSLWP